jgi:uncharacterized repeat protein (TIGR02543 family)
MLLSLTLIIFFWSVENVFSQVNFTGPELLGRPTNHSVTVNVVANAAMQAYFEYGTTSGVYTGMTGVASASANEPIETVMDGLAANTLYYYRMVYSTDGGSTWINRTEHSFHTQRPRGSTFTFTITSDSHFGQYGGQTADEKDLYALTLQNAAQDHPDFHLDCGDTFAMDPSPLGTGMTVAEADNAYFIQRPTPYLGAICHSIPYFFVLGNHENEEGWNWDDVFTSPDQSLALVGMKARKKYFPNPIPDDFYSGNVDPLPAAFATATGSIYHEDYYAWEWGDALFVVIDPFHYSMVWPSEGDSYGGEGQDGEVGGTRWDWSLGIQQYLWLKSTLENSSAKFKFIFTHQVVGGNSVYGRGGIIAAPYFEMGGKNKDGTWGWDTKRPAAQGWDLPIHQLMVENGVSIFFHGHDHDYEYETLDNIVYLEIPKPDDAGYTWQPYSYGHNEGHYPDAIAEIENSGHIRVTVSPDEVKTEYVRAYLPGDGENRIVAHTGIVEAPYTGPTHDLTLAVSPSASGTTSPSIGIHTYPENNEITITATPASGYIFDYWTGDVANPNSASTTVTMDDDKTVTAHFAALPTYDLTMAVAPAGAGTTTPTAGVHIYAENTVVSIAASPAAGYLFDHWTGQVADVNSASTTVTMDGNKTVTANFRVPAAGEIGYVGTIGSATSKTSGTSLVITTTAAVAAGNAIIIAYASDPNSSLTVSVADAAGNTYTQTALTICYGKVRTYVFAAYNVNALPSGSAITFTANTAVTARTAVASAFTGLAATDVLDQSISNPTGTSNTATGTQPMVGPTATTIQANELLIGAIGTEGPVEDAAGTWDYAFSAGPRAGTTGDTDATTNITVCLGYRIVAATGAYTAQKTGITSRYWGAAICTFKAGTPPETSKSGDINDDNAVNSTDALIVLSCDVGINVSQFCPMNCGDVNSDGLVNSTDALIILSYDVSMSVPFPVGQPGCSSSVTPCDGCNP